jgi:flagellar biogenesis protein FliO
MEITQKQIAAHGSASTRPVFRVVRKVDNLIALISGCFRVFWRAISRRAISKQKILSICGTAALGEHRFVSVVQFERERFLIGCGASAVSLLAQLSDAPSGGSSEANCEDCGGEN